MKITSLGALNYTTLLTHPFFEFKATTSLISDIAQFEQAFDLAPHMPISRTGTLARVQESSALSRLLQLYGLLHGALLSASSIAPPRLSFAPTILVLVLTEAHNVLDQSNFPLPTSFRNGVDRRTFFKVVAQATAAIGLSGSLAAKVVSAVEKGARPSVIWLHFQECTGCTESLLRTSHPGLAEVLFDLISLDYHETLMAAAGHQA